jgi:hypothetical protein
MEKGKNHIECVGGNDEKKSGGSTKTKYLEGI